MNRKLKTEDLVGIVITMETGEIYQFGEIGKDGLRPVKIKKSDTKRSDPYFEYFNSRRGVPLSVRAGAFGFGATRELPEIGYGMGIGFTPDYNKNNPWYSGDFWIPDHFRWHPNDEHQALIPIKIEYKTKSGKTITVNK